MGKGIKDIISLYSKPFNRELKATNVAKQRLKEMGTSYSTKAGKVLLDIEKDKVILEWDKKISFGEIAHEAVRKRNMDLYPNHIFEGYKNNNEGFKDFDSSKINKIEREIHYYEKHIVNNDLKSSGYIDDLFVDKKGYIHINEMKTYSKLVRGYSFEKNGLRFTENCYSPISHLIDCNFTDANLQASFYMYIIWNSNKKFKPGTITITHIKLDEEGNRTGEEIAYPAPYLLNEVKDIIKDYRKRLENGIII